MIEHLLPGASAANARVALFDFDGTISVIRSGWMEIMIPMMVEILMDLKTGEREDDLRAIVEEFVGRLTGKQTMYQMMPWPRKSRSAAERLAIRWSTRISTRLCSTTEFAARFPSCGKIGRASCRERV